MSQSERPRILIVDDEEAILETMTFTFMDLYDVLTTADPTKAMSILEENQPVSVVITDQRMPGMTGVELLKEVYEKFPETVRIILTGFADSEATIKAINDGHIYGYINKPWEPDELKAIVRRATELHALSLENRRLVEDLRDANLFLAAVMDRLRTGAVAIDREGIVRAVNKPAVAFIGLKEDIRGLSIDDVMASQQLAELGEKVRSLADESGGSFEEVDLGVGGGHRLRFSSQALAGEDGETFGRVILFKEISHEPLTRDFEEIVGQVSATRGALRAELEKALEALYLRNFIPMVSVLVRRECFDELGLLDENIRSGGDDYEFCTRLLRRYRVFNIPEPLVTRREHSANYTDDEKLMPDAIRINRGLVAEYPNLARLQSRRESELLFKLGRARQANGKREEAKQA